MLVERVEGFCTEAEWKRAYTEINEFEQQLAEFGTVIVKFWLHIDQEEQLRRFKDRAGQPVQAVEDHRRGLAQPREVEPLRGAVVEMLERTSTTYAPWTILEANCKLYARIKALRTVADAMERGLERR